MLIEKYETDNDIGKRVRELKNARNEEVKGLAELINVSPSYMSRLLNDSARWSFAYVGKVADHFNVSEDYLIYGKTGHANGGSETEPFEVRFTELMLTVREQPLGDQLSHAVRMMETTTQVLKNLQNEMEKKGTDGPGH